MDGNILEVLQAMQAQQQALQASVMLREALDESDLPFEQRRAIRKQFAGKTFTQDDVDEAIEAAQQRVQESVKAEDPPSTLALVDNARVEVKRRDDGRWESFIEGKLIANSATRQLAQQAGDEALEQRRLGIDERLRSIEERYETRARMAECKVMLQEQLSTSGLPSHIMAQIRSQFDGRVFESKQLEDAINGMWDVINPFVNAGAVNLPGQEFPFRAQIVESEYERMCTAFDGYWANQDLQGADGKPVRRFRSLTEAYQTFMKRPFDVLRVFQESKGRLAEGQKYDSHLRYGMQAERYRESTGERLQEALQVSSWGQIMGDSITRRMLAEYAVPNLQTWRQVTSDITSIADFRTQRRLRMGGYGLLPVVSEAASYTPLTSPTDEEATFAIMKRGGLEFVTLEMMANDANGNTNALRRIPARLGRAAAQTLYRLVFDIFDQNQSVAYDGDTTALFTAGHANLQSPAVVLDANGLDAMIQTMKRQTAYGNATEVLSLSPRLLLHPTALRRDAIKQVDTPNNEAGTTDYGMNTFREYNFARIQVDYWSSQTRFYIVADGRDVPLLEVGFFNGNEDPEIFVADQENVEGGAMWSADRLSYKIRHIYGVGILDHRGVVSSGG